MKKITIAIDGWSSCGKSTLAKALAEKLHYSYVDTGAMYRACTLFFLENKIPIEPSQQITNALSSIHIRFVKNDQGNRTILNNVDVEDQIRQMEVSNWVSKTATISSVRKDMVRQQQLMGKDKGIVMDGRDIGTVVFPDADIKIFLTADKQIRAHRRYEEMRTKGLDISLLEVLENLEKRDYIDSTRADSPLKKAEDAIVIDNSSLTKEEQLEKVYNLCMEVIEK